MQIRLQIKQGEAQYASTRNKDITWLRILREPEYLRWALDTMKPSSDDIKEGSVVSAESRCLYKNKC